MIFVTGGTGFLGKTLIRALIKCDYQVKLLVRPSSDTLFFEEMPNLQLVVGDVTDYASIEQAMAGCETVIHAAALFRFWGNAKDFGDTNIIGTGNVLKAAVSHGVKRVIHISSIAVVGNPPSNEIITEKTPANPIDPYQKSKFDAENLALGYTEQFENGVVILRLGALYGPWGHYAFNRLFFEEFLWGWQIQVDGGRRITFPCFVKDAARAIIAAIKLGGAGEVYNICGPSLSHKELNHIISQLSGKSEWRLNIPKWLMIATAQVMEWLAKITKTEPFYPLNLKSYVFSDWVVDSSKAQRELDFKATSVEDGVQKTLDWYKSIGFKF